MPKGVIHLPGDVESQVGGLCEVSGGELRKILLRLLEEGRIKKADYRATYFRKPRIDVVVATVYHTKEEQRRRYQSQVLPDLEEQA